MLAPTESDRLRVVLVEPRNPLNIGAAARAMSNFGVLRLRLVNPYEVAFREARSAVGAASDVLADAEEYKSVAEAVGDCTLVVGTTAVRHRDIQHPLYRLEHGAGLIRQHLRGERVALMFGSEKFGLSTEDMSHCHWLMRIPTREQHISMNLGQAVAVCLYELIREGESTAPRDTDEPRANAAESERITSVLAEALRGSGYSNPSSDVTLDEKVRRMVLRLDLRSRDAEVFTGMLRQLLWKIKSGG